MKVVVDSVSKKVNVEYNYSHIGHDTRFGHLRISDELRSTIAAKLAKKIPVNAIVDEIRDKLTVVLYDLIFNYLYRVIDSVMKKN